MLQFKSPSMNIGLLESSASVYAGLSVVSKQLNGQSGGLYVAQITKDFNFLNCNCNFLVKLLTNQIID